MNNNDINLAKDRVLIKNLKKHHKVINKHNLHHLLIKNHLIKQNDEVAINGEALHKLKQEYNHQHKSNDKDYRDTMWKTFLAYTQTADLPRVSTPSFEAKIGHSKDVILHKSFFDVNLSDLRMLLFLSYKMYYISTSYSIFKGSDEARYKHKYDLLYDIYRHKLGDQSKFEADIRYIKKIVKSEGSD